MKYEFGGTITFGVFSGGVEVPDGTTPVEFLATAAGRDAVREAFAEYWDNTGIKFRDGEAVVLDVAKQIDDETVEPGKDLDKVVGL